MIRGAGSFRGSGEAEREEGETTLDAPLAAYRVEDGEVLPAR
jgi:hypothetical protein